MGDQLADLINRRDGCVTFRVDAVEIEPDPVLPAVSAAAAFEQAMGRQMVTSSLDETTSVLEPAGGHPLAAAVHMAFSQHQPLVLSPDALWLTIAQGFALHVNEHSEALRARLVRHADQHTLSTDVLSLSTRDEWAALVNDWAEGLADHLGPGFYNLMICDFSTTGPDARTASQVVLMDTFKKYYDYGAFCICGIPQITLEGVPADWRRIRERIDVLAEYELSWWTDRLVPICDALIETAEGRPPLVFWQNIYKPEPIYGEDLMTGWLADLFPYLKSGPERRTVRNGILAKQRTLHPATHGPRRRMSPLEFADLVHADTDPEIGVADGVRADALPEGLCEVPVRLVAGHAHDGQVTELSLAAGFVGVVREPEGGHLRAAIGWGVFRAAPMSRLVARLAEAHAFESGEETGQGDEGQHPSHPDYLPATMVRLLYGHGAPVIHAGTAWETRFRPPARLINLTMQEPSAVSEVDDGVIIADLVDGRVLVCRPPPWRSEVEAVFVVGSPVPAEVRYCPECNVLRYDHCSFHTYSLPADDAAIASLSFPPGLSLDDEVIAKLRDARIIAHGTEALITQSLETTEGYYFDADGFGPPEADAS